MTPTTLALVERLANDASNGNGAMSANLPPLPEPHSTRKVWVDGIPSHLFTAEQMFAFRARGLAAQAAELEAMRADAERWRQFRDGDCSVPAGPDYPAHDLVMARLNNATENYVREGSGVADYDAAVDACAARAALKEQTPPSQQKEPTE